MFRPCGFSAQGILLKFVIWLLSSLSEFFVTYGITVFMGWFFTIRLVLSLDFTLSESCLWQTCCDSKTFSCRSTCHVPWPNVSATFDTAWPLFIWPAHSSHDNRFLVLHWSLLGNCLQADTTSDSQLLAEIINIWWSLPSCFNNTWLCLICTEQTYFL